MLLGFRAWVQGSWLRVSDSSQDTALSRIWGMYVDLALILGSFVFDLFKVNYTMNSYMHLRSTTYPFCTNKSEPTIWQLAPNYRPQNTTILVIGTSEMVPLISRTLYILRVPRYIFVLSPE